MAKKSSEAKKEEKPVKAKKATTEKKVAPAKKEAKKPAAKKETKKPAAKKEKKPAVKKETKKPAAKKETKKPAAEKKEEKPKFKIPVEKIKFHEKKDTSEIKPLRKKKPKFARQELGKLPRLKDVWRAPRGGDSKKAEGKRGKGKSPKIGYKNPESVRGLHPYGYYPVLVHNVDELSSIDPKDEGAVIASAIGRKKRNDIIKSANKLKITILNPRKGEL